MLSAEKVRLHQRSLFTCPGEETLGFCFSEGSLRQHMFTLPQHNSFSRWIYSAEISERQMWSVVYQGLEP